MSWMIRLRALLHRGERERDLDDELTFHLEMRTRENIEAGMTPAEARRAAERSFGNRGLVKEDTRASWGFGFLEKLKQDAIYAFRMYRGAPGFTLAVVITLALGIGANTAIFSVVYGALLKPLPYRNPSQLIAIYQTKPSRGQVVTADSWLDITDARNGSTTMEGIAVYLPMDATLTGMGYPEQIDAYLVSDDFFSALGVKPVLGRTFLPEEQHRHDQVIVISYSLWRRLFNLDRGVIGRNVDLTGKVYTIVGVMPEGFEFPATDRPRKTEVWAPMAAETWAKYAGRGSRNVSVLGRIKDGVSLVAARAEMDAISTRLEQAYPQDQGWKFELVPLLDSAVGEVRPAILIVFGAAALVLLIACANVANLMLARASARRREVAIRSAIGARRARIVTQLLTESTILALAGGLAGLAAAVGGVKALRVIAPKYMPRVEDWSVTAEVLVFNLAVSLVVGILFGVIPALQTSRQPLPAAFLEGGTATRPGFGIVRNRARGLLVAAQVALSIVLMVGSGLMVRSFKRLTTVPLGFNPDGVLTFWISLPGEKYKSDSSRRSFYSSAAEAINRIPGVRETGASSFLSLEGYATTDFEIEGAPKPGPDESRGAGYRAVNAAYFGAMEIPILYGRPFNGSDAAPDAPAVTIVSQSFARHYFPGEDPLGKRIRINWGGDPPSREIVGIAGDVRNKGVESEDTDEFYVPMIRTDAPSSFCFVLRMDKKQPAGTVAALRHAIAAVDKDQPISSVETMNEIFSDTVSEPRFRMELVSTFSLLALLLTAVGLYGVLMYLVTQRTHEIGVRVALGAERRRILFLVMRHGIVMVLAGIFAGLAGAWWLTRLISPLLYEVEPTDAVTFASASLVLLAVACLAVYLPARWATRLDPLAALRYE
ncbi:MAG TPA: ABC transporter permease [Blastocatellia bacterium]